MGSFPFNSKMKTLRGKIDQSDINNILRLRHEMPIMALPCPYKNGIPHPNTSRFFMRNGEVVDIFHVKPIYYQHLDTTWRPLTEVTYELRHHSAILKEDYQSKMHPAFLRWWMKRMELIGGKISVPYNMPGLKHSLILNTTSTFYPDPNPETTSCDGKVEDNDGTVWSAQHDLTTGAVDDTAASDYILCRLSGSDYAVWRIFIFWDTSALPDTDTISATTVGLRGIGASDSNDDAVTLGICSTDSTSTTGLVAGDMDSVVVHEETPYGTILASNWVGLSYNTFTLNAAGISNVSKTGLTKVSARNSKDYAETTSHGSAPTGNNGIQFAMADQSGTDKDPLLTVTHAAAATGGIRQLMTIGVGR